MEQSGQVGGQAMSPQMNMQNATPGAPAPVPVGMPPMPPNMMNSEDQKAIDFSASITNVSISNEDTRIESLLEECVKTKASDLHLQVGLPPILRIDGALQPVAGYKELDETTVERLVFATLEEDQKQILIKDKEFDYSFSFGDLGRFRVNAFHEKGNIAAAFRLIPNEIQSITELGMPPIVESFADYPRGLVLVTGPTGSGKSTTLYALIKRIKSDAINIVTLEDPVEYKMDGVNQTQVNVDAGLTFSAGLRSILRQDPDVVMVGEIRDAETANLAVQAALTGHLVFSTLHTNSAAGILPRLIDMGIEPFLIASTLNTVIGQRLVRRVAERRESYQSSELETAQIRQIVGDILPQSSGDVAAVSEKLGYPNMPVANSSSFTLVKGIDSEETPNGYKGRAGLYETIAVDDDIQKLIVAHATSGDIMRVAKMKGTVTMRQDGALKALAGITTLDEVNRVASDLA